MASVLRARLAEITAKARRLGRGHPASYTTVLEQIIHPLRVAALVADNDGRFVLVNAAACRLTGYTAVELRRLSVWDLTPQPKEHEAERLWRAFVDRREQSGEYAVAEKNGRIVTTPYAAQTNVLPGLHLSLSWPWARGMTWARRGDTVASTL